MLAKLVTLPTPGMATPCQVRPSSDNFSRCESRSRHCGTAMALPDDRSPRTVQALGGATALVAGWRPALRAPPICASTEAGPACDCRPVERAGDGRLSPRDITC